MRKSIESISVSSINDFQNDRLRWCYKWVENRVPRVTPSALTIGKILHAAFEDHFVEGTPLDLALTERIKPFARSILTEKEAKDLAVLTGLIEPLGFWKDNFPITATLEVEEPFEFPVEVPSGSPAGQGVLIPFRGRPDRVVQVFGKVAHIQNKSIGAQRNVGTYIDMARRNMHELLYGNHLRLKYEKHGMDYAGTIYNVIRKLKYRSKTTTKAEPLGKILHKPEEMFAQVLVGIDRQQEAVALAELRELAREMVSTCVWYLDGDVIPSNRFFDVDVYGGRVDPYTKVMLGEATLDDDALFKDREETYEEEVDEVSDQVQPT